MCIFFFKVVERKLLCGSYGSECNKAKPSQCDDIFLSSLSIAETENFASCVAYSLNNYSDWQ